MAFALGVQERRVPQWLQYKPEPCGLPRRTASEGGCVHSCCAPESFLVLPAPAMCRERLTHNIFATATNTCKTKRRHLCTIFGAPASAALGGIPGDGAHGRKAIIRG